MIRICIPLISGILLSTFACSGENLFPIQQGSTWNFTFTSFAGHSRGGTTDSGSILWRIAQTPSAGDNRLLIEQTRFLAHRTFFMAGMEGSYDSIYSPFRESKDAVTFTVSGNTLYRNNGQVIVIDRTAGKPDSISICDSLLDINGQVRPAAYVISGQCDLSTDTSFSVSKHRVFNFYFLQDGVGPVAYVYDSHGTSLMVGGYSWEHWQVQSTSQVDRNPVVCTAQSAMAFGRKISVHSSRAAKGLQITSGAHVWDIRGRNICLANTRTQRSK